MVIQRIQTLFLVVAIALSVVFLFVPYGFVDFMAGGEAVHQSLKACRETGLLVPTIVAGALMLIAIFCFRKPSVQKLLVVFSALLTAATIVTVVYVLVSGYNDITPGVSVIGTYWGGSGLLIVAALICEIMAYRGIAADMRLLKSYDSFR